MAIGNIFARSPFIVEIDEASQIATKIELFIWNEDANNDVGIPSSPTYTLSKVIPSSNVTSTTYNISPYIREYLSFNNIETAYQDYDVNRNNFCRVTFKRYKDIGAGYVLIDTLNYYGFDGYGYYSEGTNPDETTNVLYDEGTYYYNYDSTVNLTTDFNLVPQTICIAKEETETFRADYTDLVTGATSSQAYSDYVPGFGFLYTLPRQWRAVQDAYYANGNKVEFYDAAVGGTLLKTMYFKPLEKCKHEPIKIDFVNKYGMWDRTWFYKASYESINVTSKDFNSLQSSITSYNTMQGQRSEFNINGKSTIKVNSGWVDEEYKEVIKQIMLSEKILVNDFPAKCTTKSMQLETSLNNKTINYQLDFEFNHDVINNVI